ncbi:MAG: metallophosphoesterase [Candidatus Woesearchaeota archaeon]
MFNKKNKVYAISDLHLSFKVNKPMDVFGGEWAGYLDKIQKDWHKKVNDKKDIVLIAGDISWAMKSIDAKPDIEWISKLPGRKVMIRGNHDYWWSSKSAAKKIMTDDIYIIHNDSVKIENFIFCGTRGWTVPEKNSKLNENDLKIYNRELIRLKMSLDHAKKQKKNNEKIIAMIHYPPFNSTLEDSDFTKLFKQYEVDVVIYGHLHGKNGRHMMSVEKNGINYYLTSCDKLQNKLKRIM